MYGKEVQAKKKSYKMTFILMGNRHVHCAEKTLVKGFLNPFENPTLFNLFLCTFIQGYNSHSDEDDPERIRMIIQRALGDAQWILDKVKPENF